MRLTTHFQQLLRLRMSGAIPPFHMPEWHVQGIFTFIFAASISGSLLHVVLLLSTVNLLSLQ